MRDYVSHIVVYESPLYVCFHELCVPNIKESLKLSVHLQWIKELSFTAVNFIHRRTVYDSQALLGSEKVLDWK